METRNCNRHIPILSDFCIEILWGDTCDKTVDTNWIHNKLYRNVIAASTERTAQCIDDLLQFEPNTV